MIQKSSMSRHPPQEAWTHECLRCERAIAIACAIELSSLSSYSSAVTSYFTFCSTHALPVEPTPNTLSFYAVYMAHYIKPKSISSYLSGVCSQLEPFFPDVQLHQRHWLVSKTLEGCWKMFPSATSQKQPLTRSELTTVSEWYASSLSFDDNLFLCLLLTSFHSLLRLGELTWPDKSSLQDYRKVIMHSTVQADPKSFCFSLPGHKADCFLKEVLLYFNPLILLMTR